MSKSMNNTIRTSTTVSKSLLEALRETSNKLGNRNDSKIIRKAIEMYILATFTIKPLYLIIKDNNNSKNNNNNKKKINCTEDLYKELTRTYKEQFKLKKNELTQVSFHNNEDKVRVAFTTSSCYLEILAAETDLSTIDNSYKNTLSQQIEFALEYLLYCYSSTEVSFLNYEKNPLFHLNGNKFDEVMRLKNEELSNNKTYYCLVDAFAGALGLTMNINAKHYIVNDLDRDRVNLYLCVKHDPFELIKLLLNMDLSDTNFIALKNHNPVLSDDLSEEKASYDEAAIYLFRTNRCCRDDLNSLSKSSSNLSVLKKIDSILFYHEKLKDATILNLNVFTLLKDLDKYTSQKHFRSTLIVLDPPYYKTSGYEVNNLEQKNSTDFTESITPHESLLKSVTNFKGYFRYYYRNHPAINNLIDNYSQTRNYQFTLNAKNQGKKINERILTNIKIPLEDNNFILM